MSSSGIGWTQVVSDRAAPMTNWPVAAGVISAGSARRLRPFTMSRQTFVAMR